MTTRMKQPTNPTAYDVSSCFFGKPINWHQMGIPSSRPFIAELTIDQTHLGDKIPHVTNTEYVRWLEIAADLHAASLGYTEDWCVQHNIIWFVGKHVIEYKAELLEGDHILIATAIEDMIRFRGVRKYVMFRSSDHKVAAVATTDWILVNRTTHRPQRVTSAMVQRFLDDI